MSALAPLARSSHSFALAASDAILGVAASLARLFATWKNRRAVSGLLGADEAMLRDIGLTPLDVQSALSEPMWRDPSARLLIWSIERRAAAKAAARDNLEGLALTGRRVSQSRASETC